MAYVVSEMIILVDIDHTLSNAFWRDDMITKGDSWDSYHAASFMDQPIKEMVALIKTFRWAGYDVIAITSRPEKWRSLTNQWFLKHQIPIERILMRPDDDYQQAPELKLELAKPFLKETALLIEDRDDVCATFREAGILVLQCHARKS